MNIDVQPSLTQIQLIQIAYSSIQLICSWHIDIANLLGLHEDVVLVLTLYIGLTNSQNFMCAFYKLNN